VDTQIFDLITKEEKRQGETIDLIPSENYCSRQVLRAVGSVLSNKYAEGYPGKRYYQGNAVVDEVERIAKERVCELFGVKFANVQPYSGSPANATVYFALLSPGDKIMGLALFSGGHLTHGHPVTFSGKYFKPVQYSVEESGWIDYEKLGRLVLLEKPKLLIAGTTSYPRILDFKKFRKIADSVGAYLLADISHIAGLIIAGVHPSPVGLADVIMTTTHKTLRGPRGAILMTDNLEIAQKIDRAVFPGLQGGPHENTIAAVAVALAEATRPEFKAYGQQIVKNAKVLAQTLINNSIDLVTGGTDNHLMVIDLRKLNLTGKEVAEKLESAGIITNKNSVPNDPQPPAITSGIRIGTPAVTTRGMKEKEMKRIGEWVSGLILEKLETEKVRKEVKELCKRFPTSLSFWNERSE